MSSWPLTRTRLAPSFLKSLGTHLVILAALYFSQFLGGTGTVSNMPYEVVMSLPLSSDPGGKGEPTRDQGLPVRASALGSLAKSLNQTTLKSARISAAKLGSPNTAQLKENAIRSGLSGVGGSLGMAQRLGIGKLNTGFTWNDADFKATQDSGEISPADLAQIQKALAARFSDFRDCYEKALLTDPQMAGLAQLLIPVATGGHASNIKVSLNGRGSSQSVSVLSGCLNGVIKRISFPPKVAGNQIQFTLRVKS